MDFKVRFKRWALIIKNIPHLFNTSAEFILLSSHLGLLSFPLSFTDEITYGGNCFIFDFNC